MLDFLTEFLHAPQSVKPQYLLPKRAITQFGGIVASGTWGFVTTRIIRWFIQKYGVNMDEALHPDPRSYKSFNSFFTRALKPEARPAASATWTSPVDGAISQLGRIQHEHIFQAKGHNYTTRVLLGGDATLAQQFTDGHFACLYLSPKDYHRIHMPCAGTLRQMIYVPGDLFSVNPTTAAGVPNLFARNERVVCVFDTAQGPLALVLVGATIVGSMSTVWHGVINPSRLPKVTTWTYPAKAQLGAIELAQGDEMGQFLLGSTVVMLWPKSNLAFNPIWQALRTIRVREAMANA